jgi:hypothetical protein
MNNTIGAYYELPDGKIAFTIGWAHNDGQPIISYFFDDDSGCHIVTYEEFQAWKQRIDLRDFPNARDPRLPYVFDLFWDIKYTSQLKDVFKSNSLPYEDIEEIKQVMREHNIEL